LLTYVWGGEENITVGRKKEALSAIIPTIHGTVVLL
jgi:hypothetical protein